MPERLTSRFDDDVARGLEAIAAVTAVEVDYVRPEAGDDPSIRISGIKATRGSSDWNESLDYGVSMASVTQDWIFRIRSLLTPTGIITPRRGDRIEVKTSYGTNIEVYELMSPGDEQPWRWVDRSRRWIRVHCRRVEDHAA